MIEYLKILLKKIYKKIIIKLFLLIYNKPKLLNKKFKDETVVEYSVKILMETDIKFLSLKKVLFSQTQMILLPILVKIIFCLMPQCNITKLTI